MIQKSVSEFLDDEYLKYSFNIIENRSIPSICDSFKATQKKVIFVALNNIRNNYNSVEAFSGKIVSEGLYHHGSNSAEQTVIVMAQEFKNNIALFNCRGSYGSIKSPVAASPRYISLKLHENFDLIFKDNELLEHIVEDGIKIEPKFYLPILPTILTNSLQGIGVGFSTLILNREPKTVIKDCISYLNGKKIGKLTPHINTFNGLFRNDIDNHKKWYISGTYKITSPNTLVLTELPPSMTYEKIEELLDNLQDSGKIKNWSNEGKGTIEYVVKIDKDKLSTLLPTEIDKMFKLTDQITENFTVLDEHGKLKIFDSAEDILKHFVDFRLTYYQKRKDYQLNKLSLDISKMDNRSKFIKCVIDGKIVVNNKKKEDIIKQITANKIDMIDDSYDYLLSMPIYSLSKEKLDELLLNIKTKKAEQVVIKKSDNKETYINELTELLTILTKKEKENK